MDSLNEEPGLKRSKTVKDIVDLPTTLETRGMKTPIGSQAFINLLYTDDVPRPNEKPAEVALEMERITSHIELKGVNRLDKDAYAYKHPLITKIRQTTWNNIP